MGLVRLIVKRIEGTYCVAYGLHGTAYIVTANKYTNDRRKHSMDKIRICPVCKGELVLREGKYGEFYGCSGYPLCGYTETVKDSNKVKALDNLATKYLKEHGFKTDWRLMR